MAVSTARNFLVAAVSVRCIHGFHTASLCSSMDLRRAPLAHMLDDSELSRSFVARVSGMRGHGESRALGPDDVTADKMNVQDIVKYIMDAFRPAGEDSGKYEGCRVLMSFSQLIEDGRQIDFLGQLQPGAFSNPSSLETYLREEQRYRALAYLSEWKAVGAPEERGRAGVAGQTAAQKLLIRRGQSGNWEQMYCNLQLFDSPLGRRWSVTSIYKHDFDGSTG